MNSDLSTRLLSLWDQAHGEKPGKQALFVLEQLGGLTIEQAAACLVGERDARLLRLRMELLGREAQATAQCPVCKETVEFGINLDELIVPPSEVTLGEYTFGDYRLAFRLLTAQDAASLCSARDIEAAEQILLERCLVYLRHGDERVAPDSYRSLPRDLRDFIDTKMEEADPQAATEFEILCPGCEQRWTELFDIMSFLWAEIAGVAVRLFREVHDLAKSYGWAESEILKMHPARRQMYLSIAGMG